MHSCFGECMQLLFFLKSFWPCRTPTWMDFTTSLSKRSTHFMSREGLCRMPSRVSIGGWYQLAACPRPATGQSASKHRVSISKLHSAPSIGSIQCHNRQRRLLPPKAVKEQPRTRPFCKGSGGKYSVEKSRPSPSRRDSHPLSRPLDSESLPLGYEQNNGAA